MSNSSINKTQRELNQLKFKNVKMIILNFIGPNHNSSLLILLRTKFMGINQGESVCREIK